MAAERALVGIFFVLERVEVVGEKLLGERRRSSFVLRPVVPSEATGIGGAGVIVGIEVGFVLDDLGIAREVRADEVAIFRAPDL